MCPGCLTLAEEREIEEDWAETAELAKEQQKRELPSAETGEG